MQDCASENYVQGSVVQIDHRSLGGRVRIKVPDSEGTYAEARFDRSSLVVDGRYISEIIPGIQVNCLLRLDEDDGLRALKMVPLEHMIYEGFISDIKRLEGLAEVTIADLSTPIVFCRSHLDDHDDFRRLRTGDRVRIEIGFNNFISKRKPPRPNRVALLDESGDPDHMRLRPALRRSSSFSRRSTSADREYRDNPGRRRCPSESDVYHEDHCRIPSAGDNYEPYHPRNPTPAWGRPNSPLLPFFPVMPCGRSPIMPQSAAWMPRPRCMAMSSGAQGFPPQPRGLLPPAIAGLHRASPGMLLPQTFHNQSAHPSSRLYPHPHAMFPSQSSVSMSDSGFEHEMTRSASGMSYFDDSHDIRLGDLDDSQVLLEMTVDQLRNLMLEGSCKNIHNHD
ncbi:uncharacterized protein LOC108865290 [Galendromus occidentalis]|uniref:Uncharacterized protein LOC108865290 n=1 Tax=Galendromus occidentalis TaxID=34638 RepID=A0AAJ7PB93_9ACAR|nr:uncharacterized protein LOC108865290 [Galendromus occidentalis]